MIQDTTYAKRLLSNLKFGSSGRQIEIRAGEFVYLPSCGPVVAEEIYDSTVAVSPLWDVEEQVDRLKCYKRSLIDCSDFRRIGQTLGTELTIEIDNIKSSMINAVAYHAVAKELVVEFTNGAQYEYNVWQEYDALTLVDAADIAATDHRDVQATFGIDAPSVGKVFNQYIKHDYTGTQTN